MNIGKIGFLLIIHFLAGFSVVENDFLLVEELIKVYNYESITLFVDIIRDTGLKTFMKREAQKIQIIDNEVNLNSSNMFKKKKNALFILLTDKNTTTALRSIFETNKSSVPECSLFIKTENKTDIINKFGKHLRFDSDFNLLIGNESNLTEIHEVYSVRTGNNLKIKSNVYGYFHNGRLHIKETYLWDRRTDFLGTKFRLVQFILLLILYLQD